jgi:hypothetical protein
MLYLPKIYQEDFSINNKIEDLLSNIFYILVGNTIISPLIIFINFEYLIRKT